MIRFDNWDGEKWGKPFVERVETRTVDTTLFWQCRAQREAPHGLEARIGGNPGLGCRS